MKRFVLVLALGVMLLAVTAAVAALLRPTPSSEALHAMPCADLDGDGAVTMADFIIEISYHPQVDPPPQVDMNGDTVVDLTNDIIFVALQVGTVTACQDTPIGAKGSPPPTPTPGPALAEMSLDVKDAFANCDGPKPTKCALPQGTDFTLSVDVNSAPQEGYVGFQTQVAYGALTYQPAASPLDEVVWPPADPSTVFRPSTSPAAHAGATDLLPPMSSSNHTGTIVELSMRCPSAGGSFKVALPLYAGGASPFGTTFYANDFATRVLPDAAGQQNIDVDGDTNPELVDVADGLVINCGAPLESVQATIGAGGGSLSTGSGDPVEADLNVPAGSLPGDTQIEIHSYDSSELVLPSSGEGDVLSRGFSFSPEGLTFSPPATVTITYDESEVVGIDESDLDIAVYDAQADEWSFAVVLSRDTVANTVEVEVPHFSQRQLCTDCDGDGCVNEDEDPNIDPFSGGLRDPFHRWDYYDVASDTGPNPDKKVSLFGDILRVLRKYQQKPGFTTTVVGQHNAGATVLEVADETALNPGQNGIYSADLIVVDPGGPNEEVVQVFDPSGTITSDSISLVAPTTLKHSDGEVVQAYIESFDRGQPIGPNGWNREGPDGTIDLPNDIQGVIVQALHDCS